MQWCWEVATVRILIGVDESRASEIACEFVERRTWPRGTRVSLVAVSELAVDWTGLALPASAAVESERIGLSAVLERRAAVLRDRRLAVETSLETGHAGAMIAELADKWFADLIVVGNRGRGPAATALFGSVSMYLVDHAPCPVMVVRSPEATRALIATDGSPSSNQIPEVLAAWGPAFRGLPVEVLSVSPHDTYVSPRGGARADSKPDYVAEYRRHAEDMARELEELGWHAVAVTRVGQPGDQIVSVGTEHAADLIVTGCRGLGTLRRWLEGSVTHDVLLHTRSSVLVVRGLVPAPVRQGALVFSGFAGN